jgi:hypothetical protein
MQWSRLASCSRAENGRASGVNSSPKARRLEIHGKPRFQLEFKGRGRLAEAVKQAEFSFPHLFFSIQDFN